MFIQNPRVNLEVITSKFAKIIFPKSTEIVGINLKDYNRPKLLFDVAAFKTDIRFDLETQGTDLDERARVIYEGMAHCSDCHYYEPNGEAKAEFDDSLYEDVIDTINTIEKLIKFIDNLNDLLNSTNNPYINNFKDYIANFKDELAEIRNSISELSNNFPTDIDKDTTYDDLYFTLDNYLDILNYSSKLEEQANNLLDNNIDLIVGINSTLHDYYYGICIPKYKTNQVPIVFTNEFSYLNEYVNQPDFVLLSDCIEYITETINENFNDLKDLIGSVIESIEKVDTCPGINHIDSLDSCKQYTYQWMPDVLEIAFYEANSEENPPVEIKDEINLLIPNHYYYIDLYTHNIKILSQVQQSGIDSNKIQLYPLYFLNVHSDGLICFKDNEHYVSRSIRQGKFTSILELFWGSSFNHDLGDTIFPEIEYDTYTMDFHDELIDELKDIFNYNPEYQEYINSDNKIEQELKDWEWLKLSLYDFYLKPNYESLYLLIVDKNKNTIYKTICVKE